MQVQYTSPASPIPYGKSTKACGCCTKKCCLICIIIAIPIVIASCLLIALAVFYCYPREVTGGAQVRNVQPQLDSTNNAVNIVLDLYLTVNNSNYVTIGMSDLYIQVYYWCDNCYNGTVPSSKPNAPADGSANVGDVQYKQLINFPGKSSTTADALRVTIYGSRLSATDYAHLTKDCSSLGARQIALHLVGNTYAYLNGIKIPYYIPIDTTTKSYCCQGIGCSTPTPTTTLPPGAPTSAPGPFLPTLRSAKLIN
ncbi:hypothetical protein AKO1_005037 [Acrasis kona]|uniref:Late embryogenesis abundant protein LEA-2 subgroup domain-containing protein n=1 Tax=Acrasis kona TaxID=1008807 RepID=A0AAW2Z3Q3_9EUKA